MDKLIEKIFGKVKVLYHNSEYYKFSIQIINNESWVIGHLYIPYEKDTEQQLIKVEDLM